MALPTPIVYHWQPSTRQHGLPSGSVALATGRIYLCPFAVEDVAVRVLKIGVNVTSSDFAAVAGFAIYAFDHRTYQPSRLIIAAAATVALSSTGNILTACATILPVGRFFLAVGSDSASGQIGALSQEATCVIPHTTAYTGDGTFWLRGANVWSSSYTWPQAGEDIGTLTLQSAKPPAVMLKCDGLRGPK